MGRKAKTKQIKNIEQTNNEIATPLSYIGTVKVSLGTSTKSKIYYTKVFHNAGGASLFNYLYYCIAGNMYEELRPAYIKLYTGSTDDSTFSPVSPAIYCNATSVTDAGIEGTGTGSISLHFTIPCAYITKLTGGTNITTALLLNRKNAASSSINAACALFKFDEAIVIAESDKDYNLFIEWKLQITNEGA